MLSYPDLFVNTHFSDLKNRIDLHTEQTINRIQQKRADILLELTEYEKESLRFIEPIGTTNNNFNFQQFREIVEPYLNDIKEKGELAFINNESVITINSTTKRMGDEFATLTERLAILEKRTKAELLLNRNIHLNLFDFFNHVEIYDPNWLDENYFFSGEKTTAATTNDAESCCALQADVNRRCFEKGYFDRVKSSQAISNLVPLVLSVKSIDELKGVDVDVRKARLVDEIETFCQHRCHYRNDFQSFMRNFGGAKDLIKSVVQKVRICVCVCLKREKRDKFHI